MIGILGNQYMGDGRFRRQPRLGQPSGSRSLNDAVCAGTAGIFGATGDDHAEPGEVVRGLARRYPVSPARRIAMIEEYRAIMAAVARHDVEGTQQIVEKHARAAERNLIQRMRQAQL